MVNARKIGDCFALHEPRNLERASSMIDDLVIIIVMQMFVFDH